VSESQIRHRLRTGVWRRVCGGALALATTPHDVRGDALAAMLTWPDATLALGTAARLHGIPVRDDGRVHVIVPTPRAPRHRLVPHSHVLEPGDLVDLAGMPTTSVARTVVDCLGSWGRDDARDLLAWVGTRQLLGADALERWVFTHPGRRGNVQRAWAADRLREGALSAAEERLHALLRAADITGWEANVSLLEHIGVHAVVDVWFPGARLVLEVDGRVAHGPDRFQSDRTRQNALTGAGCTVLRYTWEDITLRPERVVAQIRAALARLHAVR